MGQAEEHSFTDGYGVEIFYRRWPAADGARGGVVIAHGASEHGGRYARFAAALNAAGYDAYALDHRGHGRTGRATGTGRMGPGGGQALLDDLGLLIEIAAADRPGRPVVLFGHSMGSMIAQAYAASGARGLSAYILSGPVGAPEGAVEMRDGLRQAADAGMADEPIDLLGAYNAAFEPARTPCDWLSRDPAEVDAYLADPLCGEGNPLTYRFVADLFAIAVPSVEPEALAAMARIPVLVVAGTADPVGGEGLAAVRTLVARLRAAGLDVTEKLYPGARHEVLNETNRDEVTADVIGWLDGHAGSAA